MHTLRPFAAALLLCVAIVVAVTARQQTPVEQAPASAAAGVAVPSEGQSPRNANYEIEARLDEEAKTIRGSETIRWRNITATATTELQFHLYWNAWRDAESTWLRE